MYSKYDPPDSRTIRMRKITTANGVTLISEYKMGDESHQVKDFNSLFHLSMGIGTTYFYSEEKTGLCPLPPPKKNGGAPLGHFRHSCSDIFYTLCDTLDSRPDQVTRSGQVTQPPIAFCSRVVARDASTGGREARPPWNLKHDLKLPGLGIPPGT